MTTPSIAIRHQVRDLNDTFRTSGPGLAGQWLCTAGVQELGVDFTLLAMRAVCSFDSFTGDNDPYGDHDFGSFHIGGQHLFWKIDYYDPTLCWGSEDPANPNITRRVLTIMLASEY